MRKFFIPLDNINNDQIIINGSDYHHIVHVLRKKVNDKFYAVDGYGNELEILIINIKDKKLIGKIISKRFLEERKIIVNLFQCLPKIKNFEVILEKTCELGINNIYPVINERSIFKSISDIGESKISRWKRIIEETQKKVGRSTEMLLKPTIFLKDIKNYLESESLKIFPWELEKETSLKQILQNNKEKNIIDIVVGSEGGFSINEVDYLKSLEFNSVTLGKRILKVETATIATISNIYYELDL